MNDRAEVRKRESDEVGGRKREKITGMEEKDNKRGAGGRKSMREVGREGRRQREENEIATPTGFLQFPTYLFYFQ